MKKLLAISIAVSLAVGISVLAYAADPPADPLEGTKEIVITLNVEKYFGMQIWTTDYQQDITLEPAVIHIGATTNYNVGWTIQATSAGLDLEGTPSIMLRAYSMAPQDAGGIIAEAGKGTYNAQVEGGVQLSGGPETIYTSHAVEEGTVINCRIDCMLFADPTDLAGMIQGGEYEGYVILTMIK